MGGVGAGVQPQQTESYHRIPVLGFWATFLGFGFSKHIIPTLRKVGVDAEKPFLHILYEKLLKTQSYHKMATLGIVQGIFAMT